MQPFLEKLNDEQIKPVLDTEGAVLVIAGAGSGKTRVLTSRIAHLVIDKGVSPEEILAITFTNKAANEMKERLEKLVGDVSDMWVCTIHSMCVKILRRNAEKIGYDRDFSIYSDTDKDKVLKRIILELALDTDKYLKKMKSYISDCKNKNISIEQFKNENPTLRDLGNIVTVMERYEAELKRSNAFDFDDLLIKTYQLLSEHKEVLDYYSKKFRYIHVDEFQDTNAVQYYIVKMLSLVHGNLFAVGDDDQSIYGWRGADINNILGFEKDFKEAKLYKLERNYRSTKKILDLANCIIANNKNRKNKVLWTENSDGVNAEVYEADEESGEAQYTAIKIKGLVDRGYSYSDFAVLMRINALSRSYEQEFMKYGLPCKVYGGFKFFERKEIKDLTAYLRILCNPLDNEAILRVINVPKRGIGDKSVSAITDYADRNGFSYFDGIYDAENLDLNSGAKAKILSFKDTIAKLIIDKETMTLPELVKSVVDRTNFMSCFSEDTAENDEKKANVNEFLSSVEEFSRLNPESTLSEYLNSITLSSDTDEINDGNFVTLATVHSVKGLEYKCVFICGLDKEIFPIERAYSDENELEEERRLMYVAITRAKERLYFTRARSRFLYGSRRPTLQSEFLGELAGKLGIARTERTFKNYSNDYYGDEDFGSSYGGYRKGGYADTYSGYGGNYASKQKSDYGYSSSKTNIFKTAQPIQEATQNDESKFKTGMKIRHKKFGDGIIVAIKDSGGYTIGDVAFKGVGVKSLVLKLAPIEIIG